MIKRLTTAISLALLMSATAARAAPPPPVEAYGHLPAIEDAAISGSGDMVAVATNVDDKHLVLVIDKGKVVNSFDIGDASLQELEWADDDFLLVTTYKIYTLRNNILGHARIEQVGIYNAKTGQVNYAMDKGEARNGVWGSFGIRKVNGRWYGYYAGLKMDRNGYLENGAPNLYRVDLETNNTTPAAQGVDSSERSWSWLLDDDGNVYGWVEKTDSGETAIYVNGTKLLNVDDQYGEYGLMRGRTPGSVIYTNGGERPQYFEIKAGGTAADAVELFPGTDADLYTIHDPYTHLLIGACAYKTRGSGCHFYDPDRQHAIDVIEASFPDQQVIVKSENRDFTKLIIQTEGPKNPGHLYVLDLTSGKASDIGPTRPGIPPSQIAPYKTIRYKAADGLEIEGILTLPPGREAKNLPVIMLPHGGPRARDYESFDWMAQALAVRGYAVLQPNFRGSSGYGQDFSDAGKGEWGGKMQTDISDGLAWLVSEGIADPNRACIFGASYGGYAAEAGITLQNGIYRCAVSYAGVSDLVRQTDSSRDKDRDYWNEYIGDRADRRALSPVNLADRADAPLLLIHCKDDLTVSSAQSAAMEKAMQRAGKAVQYVRLDGGDHGMVTNETRIAMLKAAIDFIERYNPPD